MQRRAGVACMAHTCTSHCLLCCRDAPPPQPATKSEAITTQPAAPAAGPRVSGRKRKPSERFIERGSHHMSLRRRRGATRAAPPNCINSELL